MESLLLWLTEQADQAPLIIFGLLVLAGFSFPISEDILLLASGVLASSVIPEKTTELFLAAFFGSYISDIIAYGLGRLCGHKFYRQKQHKLEKLHGFYAKHGILALMIGRMIPFGIRNGIFMTAGAGKMHIGLFLVCDFVACLLFSSLLFYLAYCFSNKIEELANYLHRGEIIALIAFAILAIIMGIITWRKRARRYETNNSRP